jgi:hypothetical protein
MVTAENKQPDGQKPLILDPEQVFKKVNEGQTQMLVSRVDGGRVISFMHFSLGTIQHYHVFYNEKTYQIQKLVADMVVPENTDPLVALSANSSPEE